VTQESELQLETTANGVLGSLALTIAPGTKAAARDRALDGALARPLADAAAKLSVVLAAAPSTFAFQQPGKDDRGRTRFLVSGRVEGDRLVPARP